MKMLHTLCSVFLVSVGVCASAAHKDESQAGMADLWAMAGVIGVEFKTPSLRLKPFFS